MNATQIDFEQFEQWLKELNESFIQGLDDMIVDMRRRNKVMAFIFALQIFVTFLLALVIIFELLGI
jgi:small neutral amino acid transporter SnatA (MarC family)